MMIGYLKSLSASLRPTALLIAAAFTVFPQTGTAGPTSAMMNFSEPRQMFTIVPALDGFSRNVSPRVATDGGANWIAVWTLYPDTIRWHQIYGYHPLTLFSRSTNGGISWTYGNIVKPDGLMDFLNDIDVRIATDGEGNWVAALYYYGITANGDPADLDRIGVYRTTDLGENWSAAADYQAPPAFSMGASSHIAVAASSAREFLVTADYSFAAKSDAGGATWGDLQQGVNSGSFGTCPSLNFVPLAGNQSMGLWAPNAGELGAGNWEAVYRTRTLQGVTLVSYQITPDDIEWNITAIHQQEPSAIQNVAPVQSFIGSEPGYLVASITGISEELQGSFNYATRAEPCILLETPLTVFKDPGLVTQTESVIVGEAGAGGIVYIFFKQEGANPDAIQMMTYDGVNYSAPEIAVSSDQYTLGEFSAAADDAGRIVLFYSMAETITFDGETNVIEHMGFSIGSPSGNLIEGSRLTLN